MIYLYAGLAAALGLAVGSFLNVCIYRLPQPDLSISRPPRSFCPKCRGAIAWYDNLPVISWLLLGARCRLCHASISARYPLVELLTAALFFLVVIEIGAPPIDAAWVIAHVFWAAVFAVLIVVTGIDIDLRIIPDELSVNGTIAALGASLVVGGVPIELELPGFIAERLACAAPFAFGGSAWLAIAPAALLAGSSAMWLFRRWSPAYDGSRRTWWDTRLAGVVGAAIASLLVGYCAIPGFKDEPAAQQLTASLYGLIIGAGSIYSIGVIGKMVFRKDAMGFGDVKLMAALGALLGWKAVLVAIFLACMLGSIVGIIVKLITKSSYIPFGPFLSAGAGIMVLWNEWVWRGIHWYQSLFLRP
ncbi:MAG: prepilin peptidase [Planctomycetota bacterium]